MLAERGAEVLSTDAVVHDLLASDEVEEILRERWGEAVAPGGELDRGRIAELVFGRPEELKWLESVLHPRVSERIIEWRRSLPDDLGVAVIEVPLLFEGEMAPMFDATIAVIAGDELRAERAEQRGTGELEGRNSRQLSQEEKADHATHVIRNDGSLAELDEAVGAIFGDLEKAAGG